MWMRMLSFQNGRVRRRRIIVHLSRLKFWSKRKREKAAHHVSRGGGWCHDNVTDAIESKKNWRKKKATFRVHLSSWVGQVEARVGTIGSRKRRIIFYFLIHLPRYRFHGHLSKSGGQPPHILGVKVQPSVCRHGDSSERLLWRQFFFQGFNFCL